MDNHNPPQQQAGDNPPQQQAEDDSPSTALQREAEECLSQMRRTVRCLDNFCNDMLAAVNELSQFDVRRWLYVTHTCDSIKDLMVTVKQQSEVFIDREQDRPGRTRQRIQSMMEQLQVFRNHRNRIADLWLRQMMLNSLGPRELERELVRHMSLLRNDVQRLLDMANGGLQVGDDQAAGDDSVPSQSESHQG
jgi:hypothetical protein